jgi:hypothetical protein
MPPIGRIYLRDSGADMTHETTKILLMIFILGSLEAAIQFPKIWKSQHWMYLGRAITRAWSTITSTDRSLQSAFAKHRSHKRRLPG